MDKEAIKLSAREQAILNQMVSEMGYYGDWCFYVAPVQDHRVYGGYIPAMVFSGVPSYFSMNGPLYGDIPFVIGQTLDEARARCKLMNDYIGLDTTTVNSILSSAGQYAA